MVCAAGGRNEVKRLKITTLCKLRRIIARLRATYPSVVILIGLVAAQVLVYLLCVAFRWESAAILMTAVACRALLLGGRRIALGVALLLIGTTPLIVELETSRAPTKLPHAIALRVDGPPRFPSPGGVQFDGTLLPEGASDLDERETTWWPRKIRCQGALLPWRNLAAVKPDSIVHARAECTPITPNLNPFSDQSRLVLLGISHRCRILAASVDGGIVSARARFIQRVKATLGDTEETGLLLALTIGYREGISRKTEDAFRRTGLSPALVFSGYQITLVFGVVWGILNYIRRTLCRGMYVSARFVQAALAVGATWVLVSLAGFEVTAIRATVALVLVVVGRLSERRTTLFGTIVASEVVLLSIWPLCLVEPSVALTYAALYGISLGSAAVGADQRRTLVGWCAILLCTFLSTSVVLVAWFGTVTPASLLFSPLLTPVFSIFGTLLGLFALTLLGSGVDGGGACARSVAELLGHLRDFVLWCAEWKWTQIKLNDLERWLVAGAGTVLLLVLSLGIARKLLQTQNFLTTSAMKLRENRLMP